jgi:hypothetical protein
VTALADGLLLVPGARWEEWFTRGHSHFFDAYPEWPSGLTSFARPAFQFVIYLAHFVLGGDWASYLAINYLGIAGIAMIAFAVARTVFGFGVAVSLLAAVLVLQSPAVLEFSIWQVGFASESLASILIGGAFLAVVARRDVLCLALLSIALFTKETSVWAPFAAAATTLLRRKSEESSRRHVLVAASMLLPVAIWLGFRFAFFGGIGDTYVTAEYTPVAKFLVLVGHKVAYLHHLFIQQDNLAGAGGWVALDQAVRVGSVLLLLSLLVAWVIAAIRASCSQLARAVREGRWQAPDTPLLLTLWAAMGLVFYLALAVPSTRYAASAVMFAWPAVLGTVMRRRDRISRLAIVICLVLSLARTGHFLTEMNPPPEESEVGSFFRAASAMNAELHQVPANIQQIYIFFAGGLVTANPEYLRAFLGIRGEIVRVSDTTSFCTEKETVVLDHDVADGVVTIRATLPGCARFEFLSSRVDGAALIDGRIRRNDAMIYEFPDADSIQPAGPFQPTIDFGPRMILHVRPHGSARFITGEHGDLRWFDVP